MRFSKLPALCLAIFAARTAPAADPAPARNPEPLPSFLTAPAKPFTPDADKTLPLGDPIPRPGAAPSLLPDEIPPAVRRPAAAKKPGTAGKPQATPADLEMRIRYAKARNAAETNAQVRAAWEDSRNTGTDLEKRQALKRYYDLLFAKMLGADRGIAALVEEKRKARTGALTQVRIAPTVAGE